MTAPITGIIRIDPEGSAIPVSVIPVNPAVIQVTGGIGYEEIGIVNFRDIGRRGNERLTTVTFGAFFPRYLTETWVNPSLPFAPSRPTGFVNLYQDIKGSKTPCWVTISGLSLAKWMVLVDFTYSLETGGEPEDIEYDMTWKEYVHTSSTVLKTQRPQSPSTTTSGTRYTIVSGDTLWGIAKRYYGDGSLWRVIWDANKPMTSGDPNRIYPGEVITIPPR